MKKVEIATMEALLMKLSAITWTSQDGRELTDGEWKVSFSTKLNMSAGLNRDMPVQIVIRITYQGHYVTSWGCIDNEENAQFAAWFMKAKSEAITMEIEIEDDIKANGKKLFNEL